MKEIKYTYYRIAFKIVLNAAKFLNKVTKNKKIKNKVIAKNGYYLAKMAENI